MQEYHVPPQNNAPNVITPQALASRVFQSEENPQAYLLLCTDGPNDQIGRLKCFHRVAKFSSRMGHAPSQWDDRVFAFHGDLVGQQITTIEWPVNAFHQGPSIVRVPTLDVLDQFLAANPNDDLIGPFQNNDAGTELVKVRRSMYVPPAYVHLLLATPLTPREAYLRLGGAIRGDNRTAACQPLIDFLRVALTRNAIDQGSSILQDTPTAPVADETLHLHRWHKVLTDMPALSDAPVAMGAQQISAGLGLLVSEQREARLASEARAADDKAKTPEKFFGASLPLLLRLTGAVTSAQLPAIWISISSCTKAQQRGVIQRAIDQTCQTLGLHDMPFPVTPDLATKIVSLTWIPTDPDDLATGLHPFSVTYRTAQELTEASNSNSIYDFVQDGGGQSTQAEAGTVILPNNPKTGIIRDVLSAAASFTMWRILCHTLLGAHHPELVAYESFLTSLQTRLLQPDFAARLPPSHDPEQRLLGPALLVRWVQLRWTRYFQRQWASATQIPATDYAAVLEDIQLQARWQPTLPNRYASRYGTAPSAPPRLPPSGRAPPAAPSALPASAPPISDSGTRVQNATFNATRFQRYVDTNIRMRQVISRTGAKDAIPTYAGADGTRHPMCPAFRVKGVCNSNCTRIADHTRPSNDAEDAEMEAWCSRFWPTSN